MPPATDVRATIDDLYATEGKAELIGGRIVPVMTGRRPSSVAFEIAVCLRAHARRTGIGEAHPDGIAYTVPEMASGREAFSPDASYHRGPFGAEVMRFIPGAPTFAVEVRSENDYGAAAERDMASKRLDYFEAGTLVVWDVDTEAELVHVYRATAPAGPTTYARGHVAEAEPAVAGWLMPVDDVFGGPGPA